MIPDQSIILTIQPNIMPHYKSLGYDVKFRKPLTVPWGHLPKMSGMKVKYLCDDCDAVGYRAFNKLLKRQLHLCRKCSAINSGIILNDNPTPKLKAYRELLNTRVGEIHPLWNPDRDKFKHYSSRVHNHTDRIYKEHKNEINPHNYKRTKCGIANGYQLDHILPIKDAYLMEWSVEQCSAIENLQMLPWLENNLKAKVALINRNKKALGV